jgi:fluoroacetyl-CoA thioesterase
MNREIVSQIAFEEKHLVTAEESAPNLFRRLPQGRAYADRLIDAMATCHLVALLESLCLREVHGHLDADAQVVVGNAIQCNHCAPIPRGTLLRISGWVQGIGEREVTFRVQAHDDHEQVCDGTIRLVFARRGEIARRIERKCEAIARRELFLAA